MRQSASLAVLAKEYIWLWDVRHGVSTQEIAEREGLSLRRVRFGIARARHADKVVSGDTAATRPPQLVPLFPIEAYVPSSPCAHRRKIASGSIFCCMVCHQSGIDGHPGLLRDPQTDPAPEPKGRPKHPPRRSGERKRHDASDDAASSARRPPKQAPRGRRPARGRPSPTRPEPVRPAPVLHVRTLFPGATPAHTSFVAHRPRANPASEDLA